MIEVLLGKDDCISYFGCQIGVSYGVRKVEVRLCVQCRAPQ